MKFMFLIVLSLSYVYSAQQKYLPYNVWMPINIGGIYTKSESPDNYIFPDRGNKGESVKSSLIVDLIDFNLSNNNESQLMSNSFNFSQIDKYDTFPFLSSRIDVRRLNSDGYWEVYSTANSASSNDFNTFEVGKGYLIKVRSSQRNTRVGIILNNHLDLLDYYSFVDGWNLVGLNDDILEHSSSSIFIPEDNTTFSLSNIFNFISIDINETNVSGVVKAINYGSYKLKINSQPLNFRAYRAKRIIDNVDGVIVVSDTIIETSATNASSISSKPMQLLPSGSQRGHIGHFIGLEMRIGRFDYKSKISISSLDGKSGEVLIDRDMNVSFPNIVDEIKKIASTSNAAAYLFNPYFNDSNYSSVLFASDKPFGISEKFYVQKYKELKSGQFYLSNIDAFPLKKPSDIPSLSKDSKIHYRDLNNSVFEIFSNQVNDLRLLENSKDDLFESLRNTNKGYFKKVYRDMDLYSSFLNSNTNDIRAISSLDDLLSHPVFTVLPFRYRTLQKIFLKKKKVEFLYKREIVPSGFIWRSVDVVKAKDWFEHYNQSTFFSINKEPAYYIHMTANSNLIPEISKDSLKLDITNFANFTKDKTINSSYYKFRFKVDYLNPYRNYVVFIVINSKVFHLYDDNGLFSLDVHSNDLDLDDETYTVYIKVVNNTGSFSFYDDMKIYKKKPIIKSASIKNNLLSVDTDNDYEIYKNYISQSNLKSTYLGTNIKDLSKLNLDIIKNGGAINLQIVAKNKHNIYSDVKTLRYTPSAGNAEVSSGDAIKNGVRFKSLNKQNPKIIFTPIDDKKLVRLSVKTMYLKIRGLVVGLIIYDIAHKNKTFYVKHNSKLYRGIFQDNDNFDSDKTPYDLILI